MPETPIDDRRFTDREVREILKRAVERGTSGTLARTEGVSLAELRAIADEVGIDPARVEEEARAVALEESHGPNPLIGAPRVLHFERRVRGELDPEATPEILALIRRRMGQQGEVSEVGGSLEWSARGEAGERLVALSSRDGTTAVQASANLTNAAILAYAPGGALGLIGALVGLTQAAEAESVVGIVFFVALLPMLWMVIRTILGRYAASEATKLQEVVEALARMAEESPE